MLPLQTTTTFFLASLLLALAPGPDNIFVLTQAALQGKMAGLAVTLGLCTGLLVHTAAVALGVAVIFKTSVIAFTVLKSLGACYLLYLAWLAFRAAEGSLALGERSDLSRAKLYRRGIIMNITNPKVSLFFLAFLPQFADPARGPLTVQLIFLGAIFISATIVVFGGISLLAGTLGEWLSRFSNTRTILNRITGGIFVVIALRLLTIKH